MCRSPVKEWQVSWFVLETTLNGTDTTVKRLDRNVKSLVRTIQQHLQTTVSAPFKVIVPKTNQLICHSFTGDRYVCFIGELVRSRVWIANMSIYEFLFRATKQLQPSPAQHRLTQYDKIYRIWNINTSTKLVMPWLWSDNKYNTYSKNWKVFNSNVSNGFSLQESFSGLILSNKCDSSLEFLFPVLLN